MGGRKVLCRVVRVIQLRRATMVPLVVETAIVFCKHPPDIMPSAEVSLIRQKVSNLGTKKLETEEDGQFLASATTYLFQIGNGLPTKQGNPQTVTFTAENVQLLNDLLDKED